MKKVLPDSDVVQAEYNTELNKELSHPTKYIIYKLAANSSGVDSLKILELFGENGLKLAHELELKRLIKKDLQGVFTSVSRHFHSNPENFISNFKAVSDFISIENNLLGLGLNPIRVNYSESVTPETYKEIIKIQRQL